MHLLIDALKNPWFWVDIALSASGGILVWYGLKIEKRAERLMPPDSFKPDLFEDIIAAQKAEIERGWRILMRGVILEVIAAFGISIISGLEIAELKGSAASANKEAAEAKKAAGEANEQAALTESNNLVLRSNVFALGNAVQDLANLYDQSTNALAQANARLSAIRPLKERLIDLLNDIDPSILRALKGGKTTFSLEFVPAVKYNRLMAIAAENGVGRYAASITSVPTVTVLDGILVHTFEIVLKPELVR